MEESTSEPSSESCPRCGSVEQLPYSIEEIYDAFEKKGKYEGRAQVKELVEGGTVYMCSTNELATYRKCKRTRDNALAPGRAQNRPDTDDLAMGQRKWDTLREKIDGEGFRVTSPVVFIIFKNNKQRKIHQGHHRIGIALELELTEIPVAFHFVPQGDLQPAST